SLDIESSICISGFLLSNNLINSHSFLGDIPKYLYFPYCICNLSTDKAPDDNILLSLIIFLTSCMSIVCLNGPASIISVLFSTRYPVVNHIQISQTIKIGTRINIIKLGTFKVDREDSTIEANPTATAPHITQE